VDAGGGRIEVRFRLGRDEVFDLFRTMAADDHFRRVRLRGSLEAAGLALVVMAVGLAIGSLIGTTAGAAVVLLAVVEANGAVWAWTLSRRRLSRLVAGDRVVAVDPGGVVATDETGTMTSPWTAVQRVIEGDRWIGFVVRQSAKAFQVLPLAAATLGEDERAALRAWSAAAGGRPWGDQRRVATRPGDRVG
jgi:uncharacterized membrane protein